VSQSCIALRSFSVKTSLRGNTRPCVFTRSQRGANWSSAELVYGTPLVLPGEFVDAAEPPAAEPPAAEPPAPEPPAANFLEHLRPDPSFIPTRPIRQPQQEANKQLQQARWVYIRRCGATPLLTPLYAGPYEVAEAGVKTFEVLVGGQ